MSRSAAGSRYGAVAILLHWLIAGLILANLALGWRMSALTGLRQFEIIQLHKSIGVTVLVLSVARLAWRLAHPPPPYPPGLARWERWSATAVHRGFYLLMLGLPLTGWIMVSASPLALPTLLYKMLPWPHLPILSGLPLATKRAVESAAEGTHVALAWTMAALVALHLGAVAKHVLRRDAVLFRMAPLGAREPLS